MTFFNDSERSLLDVFKEIDSFFSFIPKHSKQLDYQIYKIVTDVKIKYYSKMHYNARAERIILDQEAILEIARHESRNEVLYDDDVDFKKFRASHLLKLLLEKEDLEYQKIKKEIKIIENSITDIYIKSENEEKYSEVYDDKLSKKRAEKKVLEKQLDELVTKKTLEFEEKIKNNEPLARSFLGKEDLEYQKINNEITIIKNSISDIYSKPPKNVGSRAYFDNLIKKRAEIKLLRKQLDEQILTLGIGELIQNKLLSKDKLLLTFNDSIEKMIPGDLKPKLNLFASKNSELEYERNLSKKILNALSGGQSIEN